MYIPVYTSTYIRRVMYYAYGNCFSKWKFLPTHMCIVTYIIWVLAHSIRMCISTYSSIFDIPRVSFNLQLQLYV